MKNLNFIRRVRLAALIAILITETIADVAASGTFYMEDYCDDQQVHRLSVGKNGLNSTGVLMASRTFYRPGMSCSVTLVAPPGYRILANTWLLDLRSRMDGLCTDYLKVQVLNPLHDSNKPLCGIALPGDEWETFYTPLQISEMKIVFFSSPEYSTENRRGFRFSFTSFTDVVDGVCNGSQRYVCDNGRCIWNGLTCDGFDNCGDGSDEWTIGRAHCRLSYTASSLVVMTVGVFVAVIMLVTVMGLLAQKCYRRNVVLVRAPAAMNWEDDPGRGFINPGYIAWFQEDAASRKAKTKPLLLATD